MHIPTVTIIANYLEGVLQSSSEAKSFLLKEDVLITSDSLNELLLEFGLEYGVSFFSLYKNSFPEIKNKNLN